MTHLNVLARADSSGAVPASARRKAVLVCPTCGHESPVDGDWIVTLRERTTDLSCPDCRTHLTTRWFAA